MTSFDCALWPHVGQRREAAAKQLSINFCRSTFLTVLYETLMSRFPQSLGSRIPFFCVCAPGTDQWETFDLFAYATDCLGRVGMSEQGRWRNTGL